MNSKVVPGPFTLAKYLDAIDWCHEGVNTWRTFVNQTNCKESDGTVYLTKKNCVWLANSEKLVAFDHNGRYDHIQPCNFLVGRYKTPDNKCYSCPLGVVLRLEIGYVRYKGAYTTTQDVHDYGGPYLKATIAFLGRHGQPELRVVHVEENNLSMNRTRCKQLDPTLTKLWGYGGSGELPDSFVRRAASPLADASLIPAGALQGGIAGRGRIVSDSQGAAPLLIEDRFDDEEHRNDTYTGRRLPEPAYPSPLTRLPSYVPMAEFINSGFIRWQVRSIILKTLRWPRDRDRKPDCRILPLSWTTLS